MIKTNFKPKESIVKRKLATRMSFEKKKIFHVGVLGAKLMMEKFIFEKNELILPKLSL